AERVLCENFDDIKDLILEKKFIPNPRKPKISYKNIIEKFVSDNILDRYRFLNNLIKISDGFEDVDALKTVARAIVICPKLVQLWKEIGYDLICLDFNDLVLEEVFMVSFSPGRYSSLKTIISKLQVYIDLGFKLTKSVMVDIISLFESRLDEVGDIIIKVF